MECGDFIDHSKQEHLEKMREIERDIQFERRYYSGESIPAADFKQSEARLVFFGDTVWNDFKKGEDGAQFDFDREVWHTKGHPIPMKELEEHTIKEGENGISKIYE